MRRLAEKKMTLRQYFRLLLDYGAIWIYPNELTMACTLMPTNYFVVLPSRQIKRIVRVTACNYERYVFCDDIFRMKKYGSVDCKRYHLIIN